MQLIKDKKKTLMVAGIVVLCIALILAIYFIFIKGSNEPSLQETIENRITAYETDLKDSITTLDNQDAVVKYLLNWGDNKGIKAKTDGYKNVILTIPATEKAKSQPPTVVVCGYDYTCMDSYVNSIACALTVAKTSTEHGDLKIIFVSEAASDTSKIEKLSKKHFPDNAQVFYLGSSNTSYVGLSTGSYSEYKISKSYKEARPTTSKAYKISITGFNSEKMTDKSVIRPNAIKRLGNLLATFKSNSIIFELASFEGGTGAGSTPSDASMVILIDNDATTKFENTVNKAITKFNDSYSEKYPNAKFTMEECSKPSKIVNSNDTEHIVSLMYTLLNGVYSTNDDDEATAYSNIGYISIKNRQIIVKTAASSSDSFALSEITDSYQTISALSNMKFSTVLTKSAFTVNDAGKELAKNFIVSYKTYKTTELEKKDVPEYSPCDYINKLNPKAAVIYLGVTTKTKDNFAGGIIVHMEP